MRLRYSSWSSGLLALGLALSLATIGCGDDDTNDDTTVGGSGGSAKAGSGGNGGKGGKGGADGKTGGSGGAGGTVSVPECVMKTNTATANKLPSGCSMCLCMQGAADVVKCDSEMNCWPLISCYQAMCAGIDSKSAAGQMCGGQKCLTVATTAAAAASDPVGTLMGGACKATCEAAAPDAGGDAGF